MQTSDKKIAKNTLLLYVRMLFAMLVSLYTSRVVLQVLGVDDFGIYQVVGGVVMIMSYINGALSAGTSRFLTYELGRGDNEKLWRTFSTTLNIHIFFAVLMLFVAETGGLWFVYNKLVIAPERLEAAVFAFHMSVVAALFSITQIPYNASIISHERMDVYAYVGIVDVVLKLAVVYMLCMGDFDKLKLYSVLLCIEQVGIALYYRFYCVCHFKETHYHFVADRKIAKDVLSMSGWNLFANTSIALNTYGTTIIINMFFSPAIVAARAIANQVNMAIGQFIGNFRTAANPQIIKRLATGDLSGSKRLLLTSTKYSYFIMLALSLPVFLTAEPLIQLWLGQTPEYTVIFLQLAVVTSLFQVFDTSFYTALFAKGRIRENALISPTIGFLMFPVVYVLFVIGCGPVAVAWASLTIYILLGLVIKPVLIVKIADYRWKEIVSVFIPCLKVTAIAVPLPLLLYIYREQLFSGTVLRFLVLAFAGVVSACASIWFLGLSRDLRLKVISAVRNKFSRILPPRSPQAPAR